MDIRGIVFCGSATPQRRSMTAFFTEVLGQHAEPLEGFPADVFRFPDGSSFGVVEVPGEHATRTIGFLVDDLEDAVEELRRGGVEVDDIGENALGRYVHFTAPDGHLYELIEQPVDE